MVSQLHCYRAKLFRFESQGQDQLPLKKSLKSTAGQIIDGIRMLICVKNLTILDPAIVLGSLVFAAGMVECLDLEIDHVIFRSLISSLISSLDTHHFFKISGSKADGDREKLFNAWNLGIGYFNKLF